MRPVFITQFVSHLTDFDRATSIDIERSTEARRCGIATVQLFSLSELGSYSAVFRKQVLRDASSTPRKALVALAGVEELLTQSELAEKAGVSARSLRDHLPDLVDGGIVAKADAGYRLQLSFAETERDDGELPERYRNIYSQWVSDPTVSNDVHAAAGALRTTRSHHGPDGPVSSEEVGFAGDVLLELTEPWPLVDEVLPALRAVTARACYREDAAVVGSALVVRAVHVHPPAARRIGMEFGSKSTEVLKEFVFTEFRAFVGVVGSI